MPEEVEQKDHEYFQMGTGQKLESQVEKMSKSKLNGVTPDEMIEDYGADSLRLYEMFMAPFDKEKLWNSDAVSGCRRFLNRFYEMIYSEKVVEEETDEALKLGHRLVHGVETDIENLQFNTAIAKMMEFMNAFTPLPTYPKSVLKMVTQALSSFAPHICEEAWEHLGGTESLAYVPFPKVDPKYLVDETATYVIQVNGRLRNSFELDKGKNKEELLNMAKEDPKVSKYLEGEIRKVIFVPDKLLNIVVG